MGAPHPVKGEVAWIFCVLSPGAEPSDELAGEVAGLAAAERLATRIGSELGCLEPPSTSLG